MCKCENPNVSIDTYSKKILVVPNFNIATKSGDGLVNFINDYDFGADPKVVDCQHQMLRNMICTKKFDDEILPANMIIVPPANHLVKEICDEYDINLIVELNISYENNDIAIKTICSEEFNNFVPFTDKAMYCDICYYDFNYTVKLLKLQINDKNTLSKLHKNAKSLKSYIYSAIVNKIFNDTVSSVLNVNGGIYLNGCQFVSFNNKLRPQISIEITESDKLNMVITTNYNNSSCKPSGLYTDLPVYISHTNNIKINSVILRDNLSSTSILAGDLVDVQIANTINGQRMYNVYYVNFEHCTFTIHREINKSVNGIEAL